DVPGIIPETEKRIRKLSQAASPPISSFRDLLFHPHPPLDLLQVVKEFAKIIPHHADYPIPQEIASVIYFAVIAVARQRCGQRITNLPDERLNDAARWALSQPWIDPDMRQIITS